MGIGCYSAVWRRLYFWVVEAVKAHNSLAKSTTSEVPEQFVSIYRESGIPSSSPATCNNQIINLFEKPVTCQLQNLVQWLTFYSLLDGLALLGPLTIPLCWGLSGFPRTPHIHCYSWHSPKQTDNWRPYLSLITLWWWLPPLHHHNHYH